MMYGTTWRLRANHAVRLMIIVSNGDLNWMVLLFDLRRFPHTNVMTIRQQELIALWEALP